MPKKMTENKLTYYFFLQGLLDNDKRWVNQDLRIVVGATGQLLTIVAWNKLSSSAGRQSPELIGNRVSMFAE